MNTKLIKDPVHGYIKMQIEYMNNIIDSCEFQRLRNIRQTSYDSLYPGSCHNRFIHSLGVYYLGNKAYHFLKHNIESKGWVKNINADQWEQLKNTFELACLLHDVGHTPFSHTGEGFLLFDKEDDDLEIMKKLRNQKEKPKAYVLYNDLLRTLKVYISNKEYEDFYEDSSYVSGMKAPKPHEIMSVIIAMDTYGDYLKDKKVDFALFARAILGIRYKDSSKLSKGIKNALIQMLNSSIIDVDRLDYIMRDMQMSGFNSISIDIERLLESVTLIYDPQKQKYTFGYKKNALSTIENVVLAHDAERRWIQGHPVVMYDSFLIKKCIDAVEKQFKEENRTGCIFQKKSLTSEGIQLNGNLTMKLMNDEDFLFLMKQIQSDNPMKSYITEYLARDQRKSPIWKSESEFRLLLKEFTPKQQKIFMDIFTTDNGKEGESSIGNTLNDARIAELEAEIIQINIDEELEEEDQQNRILLIQRQLFWLKKLKDYCLQNGMDFDVHNQRTEVFQSKINELSRTGVQIWYEQFQKSEKIAEVLNLYNTNDNKESINLFYLYVKKQKDFSFSSFIDFLKETLNEYEVDSGLI